MNLEKQKTFLIRFAFWVIIIAIIYICLKYALPFFAPFVFGFVIAFLLNWPIRWLEKRLRVPRALPAILLTALFFCCSRGPDHFSGLPRFRLDQTGDWSAALLLRHYAASNA